MKKYIFLAIAFAFFCQNTSALSLWNNILLRASPDSLLLKAIENGDKEALIRCIGKVDINSHFYKGLTPVHYAASYHNVGLLRILISNGADINAKDKKDYCAIHYAAESGDFNIVKELISLKADLKITAEGITPFKLAKQKNHPDICKLLIENGAYDLLEAISCNDIEGVIRFIPQDLNSKTEYGATPIYLAASCGNKEIVEILLSNGADLNACNEKTGTTPLHGAAINRHKEIVDILIKNGANVNFCDKKGWAPIHNAIASSLGHNSTEAPETLKLLIQHGADTTILLPNQQTLLHFAITFFNFGTIKLLVEANIPINARTDDGTTALAYAKGISFLSKKSVEIIDYLISVGATE